MEVARHWRLKQQRYRMVGEVCSHCEEKIFPPRDICPGCGDDKQNEFSFSGNGTIYSYTTVYEAPSGFEEFVPYAVALIKLDEGPLVTAMLTDFGGQEPVIGQPVEMVTRKLRSDGDGREMLIYGYKFRPLLENE